MMSLRELQRAFSEAVLADDADGIAAQIACDRLVPQTRIGIYRRNLLGNLRGALRAVYPVVDRLVGERFFDHAADAYIQITPSSSGDLHQFGGRFPDFLADFPSAQSLVYLPDTARLEWHVHEVFHAVDAVPLALDRLREISPERYPQLTFLLNPACRLLRSDYPVHRIWAVNQSETVDEPMGDVRVDLGEGPVRALISRPKFEVRIEPLGEGEYCWLGALAGGRSIGEAVECALEREAGLDVAELMERRVFDRTLIDVI
jgi:hypothetical protein